MDTNTPHPTTLLQAIRHFSDPDACLNFMVALRWPEGVSCPTCGSTDVRFLKTRRLWECKTKHSRRQFTVKIGTIFEDSPIGLDKWLTAVWMIANCKNGISSYEIARDLGVTQKTAWFMMHRIRLAMQRGSFDNKLSGEVEVDETFIGGKARNMHLGKRKAKGRGAVGKAIVMGVLERHGEARTFVVPTTKRRDVQAKVRENVEPGSEVYTDALASYLGLSPEYVHGVIDHAEAYVNGRIHTNGLENFWSLLKRTIKGTYVSTAPFHLFRYLDEQSFRFNARKTTDAERFLAVAASIVGKRLTYSSLIAAEAT